jgi:hypothetical protein
VAAASGFGARPWRPRNPPFHSRPEPPAHEGIDLWQPLTLQQHSLGWPIPGTVAQHPSSQRGLVGVEGFAGAAVRPFAHRKTASASCVHRRFRFDWNRSHPRPRCLRPPGRGQCRGQLKRHMFWGMQQLNYGRRAIEGSSVHKGRFHVTLSRAIETGFGVGALTDER